MSPTHITFGAGAVKSRCTRSGNGTARLSGLVRFFRRFFGLATKPWRAIDLATDFSLTTHPASRKSMRTRGEPCRPLRGYERLRDRRVQLGAMPLARARLLGPKVPLVEPGLR